MLTTTNTLALGKLGSRNFIFPDSDHLKIMCPVWQVIETSCIFKENTDTAINLSQNWKGSPFRSVCLFPLMVGTHIQTGLHVFSLNVKFKWNRYQP